MNFVPRPDWYFYFLFYLLRIFKWPETVILGTVGIPTICLMLLLALPFVDLRRGAAAVAPPGRARRGDPRRHLDGRADVQGRDGEGGARRASSSAQVPSVGAEAGLRGQPDGGRGREAVRAVRLPRTATRISAPAASNLGAPDLSGEGAKNKGIDFQVRHLKCPACVNPGSPMPTFAALQRAEPARSWRRSSRRPRASRASAAGRQRSTRLCASSSASPAPRARRTRVRLVCRRSPPPTARSASAPRARASR